MYTQEKLAEESGLSAQTVNDIEGCRTWVSDKTLVKIAEVLHTSPAELLLQNNLEKSNTFDFFKLKQKMQNTILNSLDEVFTNLQ